MPSPLLRLSLLLMSMLPAYLEAPFRETLDELTDRMPVLTEIAGHHECPAIEVLAIVAPEHLRYRLLRDFLETAALEIAYVGWGRSEADFSIGPFQMKPSFAEALEAYLAGDPLLAGQFGQLLPKAGYSVKEQRRARLARLRSWEGQMRYACAFYAAVRRRFACRDFSSPNDRLHFFATAYNHGLFRSESSIECWRELKAFPYGQAYHGPQANYGQLTLLFFQTITSKNL